MYEASLEKEEFASFSMQDTTDTLEIQKSEPTEFHRSLAATYEQFVTDEFASGKEHIGIYIPKSFMGSWNSVTAEDYHMHLLSVLGAVPVQGEKVTAEFVRDTLFTYTEMLQAREGLINTVLQAHADFDNETAQFGLVAGSFEKNNLIFITEERLAQISPGNAGAGALTLNAHYSLGTEILIPIDNPELEELNSAYDIVIHELVHRVRAREALDRGAAGWLVEGMAQAHAERIAKINNRESPRVGVTYPMETLFTKALAQKLGRESLVGMSLRDIMHETNSKFGYLGEDKKSGDPLPYFDTLSLKVEEMALFYEDMLDQFNSVETDTTDHEEIVRREKAIVSEIKTKTRKTLDELGMDITLVR